MTIHINVNFNVTAPREVVTLLQSLVTQNKQIMANQAALTAKIEELKTAVTEATERVQVDVDALKKQIAELGLEQDLQPAIDQLQGSIDKLKALDPVADEVSPVDPE